jgi:hypothetical protein
VDLDLNFDLNFDFDRDRDLGRDREPDRDCDFDRDRDRLGHRTQPRLRRGDFRISRADVARGTVRRQEPRLASVSRSDSRPKARVLGVYSRMNFLGFSGIPFTRTS